MDSSFIKFKGFPPFVYKAGQYHLDIGFTAFPIRKLGWTHRRSCTSRNLPCAVFLRAYGHLSSSACKDRLEHLQTYAAPFSSRRTVVADMLHTVPTVIKKNTSTIVLSEYLNQKF